jgi:hypothetical protein
MNNLKQIHEYKSSITPSQSIGKKVKTVSIKKSCSRSQMTEVTIT